MVHLLFGQRRRDILVIMPVLSIGPYLSWYALRSLGALALAPFSFLLIFGLAGVYSSVYSKAHWKTRLVIGFSLAALSTAVLIVVRMMTGPFIWTPMGYLMIAAGDLLAFLGGSGIPIDRRTDEGGNQRNNGPATPNAQSKERNSNPLAGAVIAEAVKAITTAVVSSLLLYFGLKS